MKRFTRNAALVAITVVAGSHLTAVAHAATTTTKTTTVVTTVAEDAASDAPSIQVQETNPARARRAALLKKRVTSQKSIRPMKSGKPDLEGKDEFRLVQSSAVQPSAVQRNTVVPLPSAPVSSTRAPGAPSTIRRSGSAAASASDSNSSLINGSASSSSPTRTATPALLSNKPTGTSSTNVEETRKVAIPNLTFSINNYYSGSTVKDPAAGYQPDKTNGYDGDPAQLTTHFQFGYNLSKNFNLSINPQFATTPNTKTFDEGTSTYTAQDGRFMKPIGSFLRLGVGSFLKVGDFNWGGDFRFYPAITDDLKGSPDKVTGKYQDQRNVFRTGQNFSWKLSDKVGFSIGNIIRYYQRPAEFQNGRTAIKLESEPAFSYSLSDNFGAAIAYNMVTSNNYGQSFTNWIGNDTYVEPSVDWNIGLGFDFNPYIDIYTGDHANLDTTRWGFNFTWKIL